MTAKKMQTKQLLKIAAFLITLSEDDARRLNILPRNRVYIMWAQAGNRRFHFSDGPRYQKRNVYSKKHLGQILLMTDERLVAQQQGAAGMFIPSLHRIFSESKEYVKALKSFDSNPVVDEFRRQAFIKDIFNDQCCADTNSLLETYFQAKMRSLIEDSVGEEVDISIYSNGNDESSLIEGSSWDYKDIDSCVKLYLAESSRILETIRQKLKDPSDVLDILAAEILQPDRDHRALQFVAAMEPKYLPHLLLDEEPMVREFAKIFIQYNEKKRAHI